MCFPDDKSLVPPRAMVLVLLLAMSTLVLLCAEKFITVVDNIRLGGDEMFLRTAAKFNDDDFPKLVMDAEDWVRALMTACVFIPVTGKLNFRKLKLR